MNTPSAPLPTSSTPRRAAFLALPHAGGTYSVFVNLRLALQPLGISLHWIGISLHPDKFLNDPQFASELSRGHAILKPNKSDAELGSEILRIINDNHYDLVFVNVLTSTVEMSIPAYLPPHIKSAMIVHNITLGTYQAARAVAPFVHVAAAVCPRPYRHLVDTLKIPETQAFCLPNALDTTPYANLPERPPGPPYKIVFLGRIIDIDKGVFWLPQIMHQLADLPVSLTVAGDGPGLPKLKKLSRSVADRIHFLGNVKSSSVPNLMASHHICLMPSRFEGFGYCLIEAMAAGCVPVASKINGVTDYVVGHDQTGLLFPIGDVAAAADAIRRLCSDHALRQKFAHAGIEDVNRRFSIQSMTLGYSRLINALDSAPNPRNLRTGQPFRPLAIADSGRRFLPTGIKNLFRRHKYK